MRDFGAIQELGSPAAEKTVRESIQTKVYEEHISTIYPPIWMTGRKQQPWWHRQDMLCGIACLFFSAAVAALVPTEGSHMQGLVALFLLLAVCFASAAICLAYPLEYVENLNFVGVCFLRLGAVMALVDGCVLNSRSDLEFLVRVGGPALLCLGIFIFGYTALVTGPWELMVGSPLLFLGLCLRCSAEVVFELDEESAVPDRLMQSSIPFIVLALLLVGKKAFTLMKKPWLLQQNFLFYGIVFLSCGILLGYFTMLDTVRQERRVEKGVDILGRFLLFVGTGFFLLRSARQKDHLDITLEDRYPAMTAYIWSARGFVCAAATLPLAAACVGAAVVVTAFSEGDEHHAANDGLEFAGGVLVMVFAAGAVAVPGSDIEEEGSKVNFFPCLALVMVGIELMLPSATASILDGSAEASVIGPIGALILLGTAARLSIVSVSLDPRTWSKVLYHPGNYVLLGAVWLVAGCCVKYAGVTLHSDLSHKTDLRMLGNAFVAWGLAMLILHTSMARHLYRSLHMPLDPDDDPDPPTTPLPETPAHISTDVLVVGAGPSGLLTSIVLGKCGASVTLVEVRAEPIQDARFAILNSATMEHVRQYLDPDLFAELGRRAVPNWAPMGSMLTTGMCQPDAEVLAAANTPPRGVMMANMDLMDDWTESRSCSSRYAGELCYRVMQSHQETVLKMQADRMANVRVMYGWRLDTFTQHTDGVWSLVSPTAAEETCGQRSVRSQYIVGADGPSSEVSKSLGIKFDGLLNLAKSRSILVHAPGMYHKCVNSVGITHQFQIIREQFGICGGVWIDPARDYFLFVMVFGDKARTASPEEVVRQFVGFETFSIVSAKEWYLNFFLARSYRRGRAFLVGDAAHSWPPFGGIGGNSGYGDAANLGWKLAAACRGWGSELLLESYNLERRQQVLKTAMFVLRATPRPQLLQKLANRAFHNPVMKRWMAWGWYHLNSGTHGSNHFSQSGVQFGVRLSNSPCLVDNPTLRPDDPSCEWTPVIENGARLPHIPRSRDHDHGHDDVKGGKEQGLSLSTYTIIVPRKATGSAHVQDLVAKLRAALAERGAPVHVWEPAAESGLWSGNRKHILRLVEAHALLVVRPDFTIAWCVRAPCPPPDSVLIQQVATTLTGVDDRRRCQAAKYLGGNQYRLARKYLTWLTSEFLHQQRPYRFQFPQSVEVRNQTKADAVAKVRAADGKRDARQFATTTKATPATTDAAADASGRGPAAKAHDGLGLASGSQPPSQAAGSNGVGVIPGPHRPPEASTVIPPPGYFFPPYPPHMPRPAVPSIFSMGPLPVASISPSHPQGQFVFPAYNLTGGRA